MVSKAPTHSEWARIALAVFGLLGSCESQQKPATELLAFAAASLTDVMPALESAWRQESGVAIRFAFDASSRLARQVDQGAPADLVFFADEEWMNWVDERAKLRNGSRVNLWTNALVVVARRGSGFTLTGLEDLTKELHQPIGLAESSVPAGRYSRAALTRAGVWKTVEPHVRSADSVRGVMAWTARGDVNTGIVYSSDAQVDPRVEKLLDIPSSQHPKIVFPAAVTSTSSHSAESAAFIGYCAGARGQEIARRFGFAPH